MRTDVEDRLTFPLIAIDVNGCDVSFCDSVRTLESGPEGIDVAENQYRFYDADGRLLAVEGYGHKRGTFGISIGFVRLNDAEVDPTHAAELKEHLLRWLHATGRSCECNRSLKELVELCADAHSPSGIR